MQQIVTTIRYKNQNKENLNEIFKIRKNVFVDRLNWSVNCTDGMEIDEFDCEGTTYIVVKKNSVVIGSCRLIPTSHNTMINSLFRVLLRGDEPIVNPRVVEISRLASMGRNMAGVPVLPSVLEELRSYAYEYGITKYVFVTTAAIERLLTRSGVKTYRFGDQKTTDIEGVESVALSLYPCDIPFIH